MKVLGVIGARAGSKGVPKKNSRLLGDVPLIAHAIRTGLAAKNIDRLVFSTEDDHLAELAREHGIDVPFMRPHHLASDQATAIDMSKHALLAMDGLGYRANIVVHIFPTSPFLSPKSVDAAIDLVKGGHDSAIGVQSAGHYHPFKSVVFKDNNEVTPFLDDPAVHAGINRQDLKDVFYRGGGLFVRRRELLDEWDGIDFCLGKKCGGVVVDQIEAVNIDDEIDFLFADFLLHNQLTTLRN